MSSKRRAQPSGDAQGKEPSVKRQTRAASDARHLQDLEAERAEMAPATFTFSMLCGRETLDRTMAQEGFEAGLRRFVTGFGGREFGLRERRVGPSKVLLREFLPMVVLHFEPEVVWKCFQTSKLWRKELEALGFCRKTVQLCMTFAQGRKLEHHGQNALQLMDKSAGVDANAFLQRWWGWKGTLHEWLQAASQEPAASFLSKGAASTAQMLGLPLIQWVGKPEGRYPGIRTLTGHGGEVISVAISLDGKRIVSGS